MFELYKRIIGGELRNSRKSSKEIQWVKDAIEPALRGDKLFLRPEIPTIEKSSSGNDAIFCPYKSMWIEPFYFLWEGETEKSKYFKGGVSLATVNYEKFFNDMMRKKSQGYDLGETEKLFSGDPPQKESNEYTINMLWLIEMKDKTIKEISITALVDNGNFIKFFLDNMTKESATTLAQPVFHFLRFINLPNIKYNAHPLEAKPLKYLKKNKSNQTHYRILTVSKPSLQKQSGKRGDERVESRLPLHQVRGHLADYTQGKGLFGKYHIRLWVPDHCRGDIQYGKINKDYKIKRRQAV